jgi:hypothetical protein
MTLKAPSRQTARLASRSLKVAAVVIILYSLLFMLVRPLPYAWLDLQWQIAYATLVVERGLMPLVGLALLFAGYWVDSLAGVDVSPRKPIQDLRFWAILLSGVLGIYYLLVFPLHLNNVRANNERALERISQETTQAEAQLDGRLSQQVGQQRQQIEQLLQNEQLLNQAIESGQVSEEQASLIQQFKENPESLNEFVQRRSGELQTQLQNEIGSRRQQAVQTSRIETLKSGLFVGIGSLLLAIGYLIISWTGLKAIGQVPSKPSS